MGRPHPPTNAPDRGPLHPGENEREKAPQTTPRCAGAGRGVGRPVLAKSLVLYSLVHQPRRVRLPARPIPPGAGPQEMENLLFDPEMDKHYLDVIGRWCYHPACEASQGGP